MEHLSYQWLNPVRINAKQRARSHQLSMSTRTLSSSPSMPNHWVRYHELSMSTRHQLVFYQRQTNGRNLVSYQCQLGNQLLIDHHRTRSHELLISTVHQLVFYQGQPTGHDLMSYLCQLDNNYRINAKPMGTISACMFQRKLVSFRCQHVLQLVINQCQTTGHDLMSYPCQPYTRSYSINANALLHKGLLNLYLSRYNSVSLSYQWLNPVAINAKLMGTISSAIDVNTDTSQQSINAKPLGMIS